MADGIQRNPEFTGQSVLVGKPSFPSGVKRPATIFKRSDSPFVGDGGAQVSLTAEPGLTPVQWLTAPFRFQLPPIDTLTRDAAFTWVSFDVITENGPEERTRAGGPRLRTITLNTAVMDWEPSFQVWSPDILEPLLAVRELETMCNAGVRFRLRINSPHMYVHDDVNMVAVMATCGISEQAGEPDTRYLSIAFQEYKPTDLERRKIAGGKAGTTAQKRTHTIKVGDTLHSLARRYYKKQTLWPVIAQANPLLDNWAPSRPLTDWAKAHHKTAIVIPSMVLESKQNGSGKLTL